MPSMGLYADLASPGFRQRAHVRRPPHFHIVAPDFQVTVRISDLTVLAGDATLSQLAEALAWAKTPSAMACPEMSGATNGVDHAEEGAAAHCRRVGQPEAADFEH